MTNGSRIERAVSQLPPALAGSLAELLRAPRFDGVLAAAAVHEILQTTGVTLHDLMLALTPVAACWAVPPISEFHVGAVACGDSGSLYFGANMEFAGEALSLCTHAEQSATVNAWMHGETGLQAIAVNAAPCGYCRQFLYETVSAQTMTIVLRSGSAPLTQFLPQAFGPADLGVTGGLLTPQRHGLTLIESSTVPAVLGALDAANASYAPYTGSFAGVAIETNDGAVTAGAYSEDAAYNPSCSPAEAALSQLNLRGYSFAEIHSIALVELRSAKASQLAVTRAAVSAVTEVALTVAYAGKQ